MYGDRAAEQHEKDQPSQYDLDTVAYLQALVGSNVAPCQSLVDRVRNLVKRTAR